MRLDTRLYPLHGMAAVAYGEGVHTKHRHIKYHNFFTKRIRSHERVLDIGCGIGVLTFDIANHTGVEVLGIDLNKERLAQARRHFSHPRIRYVHGDAMKDLPREDFSTVVLSNVLEHIDLRVEFLKEICTKTRPERLLIRVPMFERDWRVPLKKELGIDYRLDSTHYIEYTHETFFAEMQCAGLSVTHIESRWGEIWAEVRSPRRLISTESEM